MAARSGGFHQAVIPVTQDGGQNGDDVRRQSGLPFRGCRDDPMPNINDKALRALTKAWITTVITTVLLSTAIAVAPTWDSAGYLRALPGALSLGQ